MSTSLHITIADFDCMIAGGMFDPPNDRRVELIEGELREMSRVNEEHHYIVDLLNCWSIRSTNGDVVRIRCQHPIELRQWVSIPQPDIAWVVEQSYRRRRPRPADVHLVIEVAKSSLRYDRGEKANLYARAGIQDYCVVNIKAKCIEVFRQPTADGYEDIKTYEIGKKVKLLAFPKIALDVKKLFAT